MVAPLLLMGAGGVLAAGASLMFIPPVGKFVSQTTNLVYPNELPDVNALLRQEWMFPDRKMRTRTYLRLHGVSNDSADNDQLGSIRWPTVDEILRLYLLGYVDTDKPLRFFSPDGKAREYDVYDLLKGAQVPKELSDWFIAMAKRPLSLEAAVRLFRRFGTFADIKDPYHLDPDVNRIVSSPYESTFRAAKRNEGLGDQTDGTILDAYRVFPGVDDLIRFAVREVYSPGLREKLSLFEDVPPKFLEEVRKMGLHPDDALSFWAAHWQLPSATEGFEMFQRGVIKYDDLSMLLRALDYAPVWRPRLIAMAYKRIIRVDLRRMYQDGLIPHINPDTLPAKEPANRADIPEIVERHMSQGYDYESSVKLVKWIDRRYPPAIVSSAISETTKAFEAGFITKDQFKSLLGKINIPQASRDAIEYTSTAKRNRLLLDVAIKKYVPLLLAGEITKEELQAYLEGLGLSSENIDLVIDKTEISISRKRHGLTQKDILRLYGAGLIKTRVEAEKMLDADGLVKTAIKLLLDEIDGGKEIKAQRKSGLRGAALNQVQTGQPYSEVTK
jgi:DNA-binding transcriptional ArsR family regulator